MRFSNLLNYMRMYTQSDKQFFIVVIIIIIVTGKARNQFFAYSRLGKHRVTKVFEQLVDMFYEYVYYLYYTKHIEVSLALLLRSDYHHY